MKKKMLSLAIVALLALGLFVACESSSGRTGTATAYGLVHGNYVGIATVTAEKDKVTAVVFDEIQMPYDWAAVARSGEEESYVYTLVNGKTIGAEYVATLSGGSTFAAKKIKIGTEIFTIADGAARGAYINNTISAAPASPRYLANYVRLEYNAKWYHDQMVAGNYEVLGEDDAAIGTAADWASGDLTKNNRWLKSKNAYWPATHAVGIGWEANMQAMATALVGKDMNALSAAKVVDGKWNLDGATSATLIDFNDYISLAQLAFNKI